MPVISEYYRLKKKVILKKNSHHFGINCMKEFNAQPTLQYDNLTKAQYGCFTKKKNTLKVLLQPFWLLGPDVACPPPWICIARSSLQHIYYFSLRFPDLLDSYLFLSKPKGRNLLSLSLSLCVSLCVSLSSIQGEKTWRPLGSSGGINKARYQRPKTKKQTNSEFWERTCTTKEYAEDLSLCFS